ncbi:unnamed protein product [Rhodiola kirilowii]
MSAGLNLGTFACVIQFVSSSFCFVVLCLVKQSSQLCHSSDSMRLWPKRNSSGAECFNGFHIERFVYLLLFLRSSRNT